MNLIDEAKKEITALLAGSYERAAGKGLLPAGAELAGTVEIPKDTVFGDNASSAAAPGARHSARMRAAAAAQ